MRYPSKIRPIRVEGDKAYVPLTQGKEAIIDKEDIDKVSQYTWFAVKNGCRYATTAARNAENRVVNIAMHRLIMDNPVGFEIDHVDGDGLNNTKLNLRLATRQQNAFNLKKPKNNTSGFKGVSWCQASNRWKATISVNRVRHHLGFYNTKEQAYQAYCQASERFHGEFGRIA